MVLAVGGYVYKNHHNAQMYVAATQKAAAEAAKAATDELASHCKKSLLDKEVVVSVSKRHMWACQSAKTVYDNPVITGMEMYPADLTPRGTYKIYAKATDTVLKGSDASGSWSDSVSYWMPFLDNQYGTYGFHDATWRAGGDFGKIDPNSKEASHGCVEMPLAAMKWLYAWAPVGTTVVVQD